MKVIINPEYAQLTDFVGQVPTVFESSGEIIYEGRNILKRFEEQGIPIIVKRFKIPHLLNRLVYTYVRKSKAYRSYVYALQLLEQEVGTPFPIAFIEDYQGGVLAYSYYVSVEIANAHEIREFWYDPQLQGRSHILEGFGVLTAALHRKNILHKDYSSGNILYTTSGGALQFYLVDINRMRFGKPVTEEEGYKNFKKLWLTDEPFTVIAQSYAKAMGYKVEYAVERMLYHKNKFMKR